MFSILIEIIRFILTFSFCSLLREVSQVQPYKATSTYLTNGQLYPARKIFRRWASHLREVYSPSPLGTTAAIFKLLFPEDDTLRKFNMQETTLAERLTECFCPDSRLRAWCLETSSGCLGEEVKLMLEKSCPVRMSRFDSHQSLICLKII